MFAVNAVEAALLWCTTSDPGAGLVDPRVLAAMEDMAGRLTEPITVADLAAGPVCRRQGSRTCSRLRPGCRRCATWSGSGCGWPSSCST